MSNPALYRVPDVDLLVGLYSKDTDQNRILSVVLQR